MTNLTLGLPKKGLVIAHLNICCLINKIHEIDQIVQSNHIHVLALSETHLDSSFVDAEVSIYNYTLFRKDRNKYEGGVALYIQNQIPAKERNDIMVSDIEALLVQVHLPYSKPILIGCCYRPPNAKIEYLEGMCDLIDKISDENK